MLNIKDVVIPAEEQSKLMNYLSTNHLMGLIHSTRFFQSGNDQLVSVRINQSSPYNLADFLDVVKSI